MEAAFYLVHVRFLIAVIHWFLHIDLMHSIAFLSDYGCSCIVITDILSRHDTYAEIHNFKLKGLIFDNPNPLCHLVLDMLQFKYSIALLESQIP
jgi:hypothetical protein